MNKYTNIILKQIHRVPIIGISVAENPYKHGINKKTYGFISNSS